MKNILKNKLTYFIALLAAACLMLFAGLTIKPVAKVEAANATQNVTDVFTFKAGASVRLDTVDNTSGIRFTATFGEDFYLKAIEKKEVKEVGMLIVPDSYITAYEKLGGTDYFDFITSKTGLKKEQFSVAFSENKMISEGNGVYSIRGALVKIRPQNYELVYRAVAYYQDEAGVYHYTLNEEGRSVAYVSVKAIENEDVRAQTEGKYTDPELSVLYGYANGNVPRVMYDADREKHEEKFTQVIPAENTSITGATLTRESLDGEEWFKVTVTDKDDSDKAGALGYDISMDGIDLSAYDYFVFRMKTSNPSVKYQLATEDLNVFYNQPWESFAGEEVVIKIPVVQYENEIKGKYYFSLNDLSVGDTVYMSSFVAYGAKSVDYMIDGLPQEGFISLDEKENVGDVRAYYDALSNDAKTGKIAVQNLDGLEVSEALPLVVYEAGVEEDEDRFHPVNMEGVAYANDVSSVEKDGDFVFTMQGGTYIEGVGYVTAYTYELPDDVDFSKYSFVTFGVSASEEGAYFGALPADSVNSSDVNSSDVALAYWTELQANAFTDICISVEDFLVGANGSIILLFVSPTEGTSYYMSDVRTMGADSLKGIIDRLDKEGTMTATAQQEVLEARKYYDLYVDFMGESNAMTEEDTRGLLTSEGREYPILDATDPAAMGRFIPVALDNDGDGWQATVTQVTENGRNWFKFTVTQKGQNGILVYKVNMSDLGVDLSEYQRLTYEVKTDATLSLDFGQDLNSTNLAGFGIGAATEDSDGVKETKNVVPVGGSIQYCTYLQKSVKVSSTPSEYMDVWSNYYIVLTDLEVGESIYFSDFLCYNLKTLATMIEKLPDPSEITMDDYDAVQEVVRYATELGDLDEDVVAEYGKEYVNNLVEKFNACVEALSGNPIYAVSPTDPAAAEKIVQIALEEDDVYGWEGTVENYVDENGEAWLKFTVGEVGTSGSVFFDVDLSDYDIETYPMLCYTIKSDNPNAGITLGISGNTAGLEEDLNLSSLSGESIYSDEGYLCCMSSTLLEALELYFDTFLGFGLEIGWAVTGLKPGDVFYISGISLYNEEILGDMLHSLPYSTNVENLLDYEQTVIQAGAYLNGYSLGTPSEWEDSPLVAWERAFLAYYLQEITNKVTTATKDTESGETVFSFDWSKGDESTEVAVAKVRTFYNLLKVAMKRLIGSETVKQMVGDTVIDVKCGDKTLRVSTAAILAETKASHTEYLISQIKDDASPENLAIVEQTRASYQHLHDYPTSTGWFGSATKWVDIKDTCLQTLHQKELLVMGRILEKLPSLIGDVELEDEANILWVRDWYLEWTSLYELTTDGERTLQQKANDVIGSYEAALAQLYIDGLDIPSDPAQITLTHEREVLRVRNYLTLLDDTYKVDVSGVDTTLLEACEITVAYDKLAKLPALEEIGSESGTAVSRLFDYITTLMNDGVDVPVALIQEFLPRYVKVTQCIIDELPAPSALSMSDTGVLQTAMLYVEKLEKAGFDAEALLELEHGYAVAYSFEYLTNMGEILGNLNDSGTSKKTLLSNRDLIEKARENFNAAVALGKIDPKSFDGRAGYDLGTLEEYELGLLQKMIGHGAYYREARTYYQALKSYGVKVGDAAQGLFDYEKGLLKDFVSKLPEDVNGIKETHRSDVESVRYWYDILTADGVDVSDVITAEELAAYENALLQMDVTYVLTTQPDTVTVDDQRSIEAARAAYDGMSAEEKATYNEENLKAWESALTAALHTAKIDAFTAEVQAIYDEGVTEWTAEELHALRAKYEQMKDGYDVSAVVATLSSMERQLAEQMALDACMMEIAGRGTQESLYAVVQYILEIEQYEGAKDLSQAKDEVAYAVYLQLLKAVDGLPALEDLTPQDAEAVITLYESLMALIEVEIDPTQYATQADEVKFATYMPKLYLSIYYMGYSVLEPLPATPTKEVFTEEVVESVLICCEGYAALLEMKVDLTALNLQTKKLEIYGRVLFEAWLENLPVDVETEITAENVGMYESQLQQLRMGVTVLTSINAEAANSLNLAGLEACEARVEALKNGTN